MIQANAGQKKPHKPEYPAVFIALKACGADQISRVCASFHAMFVVHIVKHDGRSSHFGEGGNDYS